MGLWTPERHTQAMTMRFKERKTFREIGEHLGITTHQVANHFRGLLNAEADRKSPVTQFYTRSLGGAHRPPAEVLLDRDKRVNAPRTPNMEILGDPVVPRWFSR